VSTPSAPLDRFQDQQILVIGDVILDRYWWGEALRLSPEAPVPVVKKHRCTVLPGGAANTAANLAAMDARPRLIGVVGADPESDELRRALSEAGVDSSGLIVEPGRPTTTKTRVIASHQQIVRVDDEETASISPETIARAESLIANALATASGVVVSDYAKGFLPRELLGALVEAARKRRLRVFVDPKGADYTRYQGCFLLKPNRLELSILTHLSVRDHTETLVAGSRLSELMPDTAILVTEGADGMTLFAGGQPKAQVASARRQVFDVTGAGDTVLATVALAISAGASEREAMELASEAAAIAIGTMGTAAVTRQQLAAARSVTPIR
jgi:rfaE bifunctional protein kinase chain/domain